MTPDEFDALRPGDRVNVHAPGHMKVPGIIAAVNLSKGERKRVLVRRGGRLPAVDVGLAERDWLELPPKRVTQDDAEQPLLLERM